MAAAGRRDRLMRILLLTEFYPPILGGVELHVQTLARALMARGHDVHVATVGDPASGLDDDLPVHRLHSTSSRLSALHERSERPFLPPVPDPEVAWQLGRLMTVLRPDVVHAHNWMAVSLLPVWRRPPLVLTAHDYQLLCARRDLQAFGSGVCAGPSPSHCLACSAEHFGPFRGALVAAATVAGRRLVRADAYVAVSRVVADRIRPYLSSEPYVIPNFVPDDIDSVGAAVDGLDEGRFVMYAGALGHHKGTDVILDAWRAQGGMPAKLLMALTGTAEPALPPGVQVLHLSRAQVMTAWRQAAVAVVPSLWADPCPTVAMEAMSAGTPVVASSVGGLVDLVDDGVDGLLVHPGNPTALRAAVMLLLGDDALRGRMGAAALARSRQFRAGPWVTALEEIYAEVIDRRATAMALARAGG
jgi:glycosyltransferase involved in cell wall biosynthesis